MVIFGTFSNLMYTEVCLQQIFFYVSEVYHRT